jgi:hypothetical protein
MADHSYSALLLRWNERGGWNTSVNQLSYFRDRKREASRHTAVIDTRTGQYGLLNYYGYALFRWANGINSNSCKCISKHPSAPLHIHSCASYTAHTLIHLLHCTYTHTPPTLSIHSHTSYTIHTLTHLLHYPLQLPHPLRLLRSKCSLAPPPASIPAAR